MDVKCERCGTEYEFEDQRVTEEGVTVKCSTCGHLFKIRKKSFVLTEPVMLGKKGEGEEGERNWMIRKGDGTVLSFKELTTLQKWIVERKVSREDEISKSGENWKRLGSIAELASFFQVVDQAAASSPGPGMGPAQTPLTVPQTPAALGGSFQPSPPVPTPAMGSIPSSQAPSTGSMPAAVPPAETSDRFAPQPIQPYPQPAVQAPQTGPGMPAAGAPMVPPPPGMQGEPDSWGDDSFSAADDVVEKWKKRGRRKWFVIVPLLLLVAGVGVWYLVSPETFMLVVNKVIGKEDKLPDGALAKFGSGYAHFLKDSDAELGTAIQDLDGAIQEAQGRYPEAMALLAEARVTRADKVGDKVDRVDAEIKALEALIQPLMPKDGKEPAGEAKKKIAPLHNQKVGLQQERLKLVDAARKDLEEAKRLIDKAREVDPQGFAPKRAWADYLRVMTGDRAQMLVPLEEARGLRPDDPELNYIDGASLAGEAGSLDAAVQMLERAIDLQQRAGKPELVRARYRLAAALAEQKKPDDARIQLERILAVSPDHQQARALLATLEKKPEEPEKKPEEPEKPAEPGGYEGWMAKGDAAQKKGRYKEALAAYDAALEGKPGDVEALTAKGYCYLDMGSNAAAIKWFQQALRTNGRYAAAIMGIAEAHKYNGNNDQAVIYYQKYLDVLPNGPEANIARRNLKELK